tara:strand:- start:237 stop:551 length:315 start_codon:yes stop_codon:yes gene_type:complete
MIKTISIALFVLVLSIGGGNIYAAEKEMTCYSREKVEDMLKTHYNADLVAMGVVSNGSLSQLYIEPDDSFHLIIIPPNNISIACPLMWGKNWSWTSDFLDTAAQ